MTTIEINEIFPVAQMVKNLPATQETWVRSLGQEDPLEKGLAIHSSILAWRIPRIEGLDGLQFMGSHPPTVQGTGNAMVNETDIIIFTLRVIE